MPQSFNGVGTSYYGKRDFRSDGSFVTTEWIIFFWIPIIPLRSHRVLYLGVGDYGFFIFHSSRYEILSRQSLSWKQVISVYLFVFSLLYSGFFLFLASPEPPLPNEISLGIFVGIVAIPFLLRYRAKKRAGVQS